MSLSKSPPILSGHTLTQTFAHDLVHENAVQRPDDKAISSWDGEFSYGQMDTLSLQLAQHLASQGMEKGEMVPLVFEKSVWIVIAMLAVLKAGGTFVALDAGQPKDRIKIAVEQTAARIALASRSCALAIDEYVDEVVIVDKEAFNRFQGKAELSPAEWNDAAYVIFTSGSTGIPKGVIIEHQQLIISSYFGGKAMKFNRETKMLQFASYAFDACILEIITTLIHGGCVCIPSEWERFNDLPGAMTRMRVSAAFFTPSLLRTLSNTHIDTLKIIILGGERIPEDMITIWSTRVNLILAYGPTECTVICLTLEASAEHVTPGNIGRAIPGTGRALIADRDDYRRAIPLGEVGEILFEGPVLARGYLNDQSKTERSFVFADRSEENGETVTRRLYRTGDLGRFNKDGTISFMGRLDNQVKVRGQRLELEEVELHLSKSFPLRLGLEHLVVDLIKPNGETAVPILAAFFVAADRGLSTGYLKWDDSSQPAVVSSEFKRETLAGFMAETAPRLATLLPSYAVPAIWIPFQRFPMAVSGKVDKRRLHAIVETMTLNDLMGFLHRQNIDAVQQPIQAGGIESTLQGLWAKALSIPRDSIQASDNFFWRGGDSVTAIGLAAGARSMRLKLTISDVFQFPILGDMAKVMIPTEAATDLNTSTPFVMINNEHDLKRSARQQCGISSDKIDNIFPCSPTQQALMASSIRHPGAYVMQFVSPLPQDTDLDKFRLAWQRVTEANEILRARIIQEESGEMFNVINSEDLLWQTKTSTLPEFLNTDKRDLMQLGSELVRFRLVESPSKGDATCHFVWTVHHAVIDGWSLPQVLEQVEAVYNDQDMPCTMPYSHFIQYLMQGSEKKKHALSFWAGMLDDGPTTSFPEYTDPACVPFANQTQHAQVVLQRKTESNITMASLVRAAWMLLIGTYSGTTDVISGIVSNGRGTPMEGAAQIIGPTVATLPFRVCYDRTQVCSDFVAEIQSKYLDAIKHEHLGLYEIGRIGPDIKASCDLRTLLVIQNSNPPGSTAMFKGMEDMSYYLPYPFTLECTMEGAVVKIRAIFDSNVLDKGQVTRMITHFSCMLRRMSDDSGTAKVSEVIAVNEDDLSTVLQWNSVRPEPVRGCVHHFLKRRALQHPESIALLSRESRCSYKLLEHYSSALSSFLRREFHVEVGTIVPLCFEKSTWAVVAMLAVLKSGGAIVCLDPKSPVSRNETILQELGPRCSPYILTSVAINAMATLQERQNIVLSEEFLGELPLDSRDMQVAVGPADLALIVSTSGSTGRPKSIMIDHSAISTSISIHGKAIGLSEKSRVLQFAAYTFDISIGDIFATLFHGGCVCIPSEYDKMNNLAGTISDLQVNTASLTSTVATMLSPDQVPSLTTFVQAGEKMTRQVVRRWADHVRLLNFYGPAECTIYCVGSGPISVNDDPDLIGKGLGATTWIVDQNDYTSLVPIGCTGELLVEGPLLSRGYINDAKKTRELFVEPAAWPLICRDFDAKPTRLYKTGDLVKYTSNGTLSFVGRSDGQLKLRGQRIDVGEVEFHIAQNLPLSSMVAVEGGQTQNGTQILAAFLQLGEARNAGYTTEESEASTSPSKDHGLISDHLEKQLAKDLPRYMVPSVFISLAKMPLLSSGKIDRKRLRAQIVGMSMEQIKASRSSNATLDRQSTEMETVLQGLWHSVLESRSPPNVEDNFFHSGGDSMLAMRLVAAARKSGYRLTVADIFTNPQLHDMALKLQSSSDDVAFHEIPPFSLVPPDLKSVLLDQARLQLHLEAQDIEDIYPCLNMQARFAEPRTRSPTQLVFKISPNLDRERFIRAWRDIAEVQDVLQTRLLATSHGWFQVKHKSDLAFHAHHSLKDYIENDRAAVMLVGEPLFRFAIISDKSIPQDFFVVTMSHAAYDAVTLPLLFEDVSRAYDSQRKPKRHSLSFTQVLQAVLPTEERQVTSYWQPYVSGSRPLLLARQLYSIPPSYTPTADMSVFRDFTLDTAGFPGVSKSTAIEVALAVAIGRHCAEDVVIFAQHRTGRNIPVPGVENSVVPTMTRSLNKIEARQDTNIRVQLQDVQRFHVENALREHHPWDLVARSSNTAAEACEFAIQLCITAESDLDLGQIGRDVGIRLAWTGFTSHVPLRFDVSTWTEGRIRITATFDRNLVSLGKIDAILCLFEHAAHRVLTADESLTVKDIRLTGDDYSPSQMVSIRDAASADACLSAVRM